MEITIWKNFITMPTTAMGIWVYSGWPNTGSSAPYRLSILLMAAMAATSEIWDSKLHSPRGKNRAARLPRGAKLSARRVTDCIRHRYHTDSPAVSTWPSTVATAAPSYPIGIRR